MKAAFDSAAADYDLQFTQSLVGKSQRERVWQYLEQNLNRITPLRILELNCGTGEDAVFLTTLGHQVLATDISEAMLQTAKAKATNIQFQQLDIAHIDAFEVEKPFDVVFSNFGGLNCLDPTQIQNFAQHLPRLLQTDGQFIAVLMPESCLLEQIYLLLKMRFSQVRRRYQQPLEVQVEETLVKTWYYAPASFIELVSSNMEFQEMKLVGLIPSYLNAFFTRKKLLFKRITRLEDSLIKQGKGESISDHYLIAFRKLQEQ